MPSKRNYDALAMRLILAVVGLVLLGFALYLWGDVPDAKPTSNFETTWTTVVARPAAKSVRTQKPPRTAAGKSAAAAANSAAAAKKSAAAAKKSAATANALANATKNVAAGKPLHDRACKPPATAGAKVTCVVKETVNTPATESRRSESLTGILLGLGGVLLLTMAFFGKIQKINLPGGSGIELVVPQETQAKVAGKIGATPEFANEPTKAQLAYVSALSKIQSKMLEDVRLAEAAGQPIALTSPGDDYVEQATTDAINEVLP